MLSDDTCRLLATWIIAYLDMNGVFYAEPAMVKSFVFPRRADLPVELIASYLDEMEERGLMYRFEANGDLWQCWPGFAENQPGLRRERESSDFPAPETCRQDAGKMPEDGRNDAVGSPAEGEREGEREGEGEVKQNGKRNGMRPPPPSQSLQMPPAVQLIAEITGRTVATALHTEIDECVGRDPPALELFEAIVRGWMARGWNPTNIAGMLDHFERKEIPGERARAPTVAQLDGKAYISGQYAEFVKH